MKKFFMMLAIMFASMLSINAQIATENAKLFDNTYAGAKVGLMTPMNFDHVFPLNTTFGVILGKQFTPVVGMEIEGDMWFGSHSPFASAARFDMTDSHNMVRASYVGVNGTVNLTNLFKGYNGTPRFFEVGTNVGLGWIHYYTPWNATHMRNKYDNFLGMKTGVDLNFNLGKALEHTLQVKPVVYWNLSEPGTSGGTLAFNKLGAQVGIELGYVYHFKTSNGTHHFKQYNVGALIAENNRLLAELEKKPKEVVVTNTVTKTETKTEYVTVPGAAYIFFAKADATLDATAKEVLDKVTGTVEVIATASPEGSREFNQELSQRRADVVKEYLESKGVKVVKAEGLGVVGDNSGRVAIVTVTK